VKWWKHLALATVLRKQSDEPALPSKKRSVPSPPIPASPLAKIWKESFVFGMEDQSEFLE